MIDHDEIELFYQHLNSVYQAINNNDKTHLYEDIAFFNEHCQFDAEDQHTLYMLLQQNNPLSNFKEFYNDNNKEIYDILFEQLENIPYKEDAKLRYNFYLIERAKDREQFKYNIDIFNKIMPDVELNDLVFNSFNLVIENSNT